MEVKNASNNNGKNKNNKTTTPEAEADAEAASSVVEKEVQEKRADKKGLLGDCCAQITTTISRLKNPQKEMMGPFLCFYIFFFHLFIPRK